MSKTTNTNIKKIISKESKLISEKFANKKSTDRLSIKIHNKEIKQALRFNNADNTPYARFSNDFINQINSFTEYNIPESEGIDLEFDSNCNPLYVDKFKKAWRDYFAFKIYKKEKDIKEVKHKSLLSFAIGIIFLLVVIGFGIGALFCEANAFKITAIVVDSIFSIASWVLIWEFFYDMIYIKPEMKHKQISLYKMYIAKMTTIAPPTIVTIVSPEPIGQDINEINQ